MLGTMIEMHVGEHREGTASPGRGEGWVPQEEFLAAKALRSA